MDASLDFTLCTSCQFENHPYCRFCLACGLPLGDVAAVVREAGGDLEGLDPTANAAPPTQEARDFVRRIAESQGLTVSEAGNGWKVQVSLPGGRGQAVFVRFSGTDDDGDELISFVSLSAPADPANALALLRLNDTFHYCRVAALEVQGQQVFGVVAKQLSATADDAEVAKMLLEVARRADALEERLRGGADDY